MLDRERSPWPATLLAVAQIFAATAWLAGMAAFATFATGFAVVTPLFATFGFGSLVLAIGTMLFADLVVDDPRDAPIGLVHRYKRFRGN